MKTFTKILAATALLASTSTAALAQGNSGAALDAAGSVSVDAAGASVDAGATGNANANANSNAGGNGNSNAGGAANSDAGGNANSNAGGNGNGALNAAANSNAGGNASANASTSAEGQLNYGQIISELRTSTTGATDIEALGEESIEVEVVTLSELQGSAGENASALEQAVSTESTLVTELKAEGATDAYPQLHDAITAAIQAEFGAESEYSMEDVVAITSSADGQVTVIIDDAAE